jgi:hypothetical protein
MRSFVRTLSAADMIKMISYCSLLDVIQLCLLIGGLCRRSVQGMGMEEKEKDMLLGWRPCDDTSKDQQIIHVA